MLTIANVATIYTSISLARLLIYLICLENSTQWRLVQERNAETKQWENLRKLYKSSSCLIDQSVATAHVRRTSCEHQSACTLEIRHSWAT